MSDNESNEEKLISLFDFKVGNSIGQNRSNKNPYFHFVFSEEYDKSINFSKPASIVELDKNEETIKVSFGGTSENESSHLLSGQRFEDNTDEMDDDAEKNYLLIFDETTKTYTLECLDYEFHISSYEDAELERELKSRLMEEEDQSYIDEEEDDGYEEKFREEMEIEGNGENGITNEEYEDEDGWMEDDRLEEDDAPSPQPAAEDDMYGPPEDEDDITKDEISGSSNSSSSDTTSSSSSGSDNSGDDGSDSTSELGSEFGDIEAEMKQSMNNVAKSPRIKKEPDTTGGKRSNGEGNPISLEAYLGGGGGAKEQDQDDSSDDSDL